MAAPYGMGRLLTAWASNITKSSEQYITVLVANPLLAIGYGWAFFAFAWKDWRIEVGLAAFLFLWGGVAIAILACVADKVVSVGSRSMKLPNHQTRFGCRAR